MAYELALPPGLSGVHPVFHVSMLKRYHGDGNYIIRWDSVLFDENLSYEEEPVAILDREVRKLRSTEIASIKVQWKNRPIESHLGERGGHARKIPTPVYRFRYSFSSLFSSYNRSGTNDG